MIKLMFAMIVSTACAIQALALSAEDFSPEAQALLPDTSEVLITLNDGSTVGSSRVDLQACKLEYSIVSPK